MSEQHPGGGQPVGQLSPDGNWRWDGHNWVPVNQAPPGQATWPQAPHTPQQQSWGLMLRPPLPPRRGMWFAFQPAQPARFWMHRTPNPLDLLYIRDNRVVKIDRALPPCMRLPCPIYGTQEPVDGVLEIGAGQAEALGIEAGAAVRIAPLSAADR